MPVNRRYALAWGAPIVALAVTLVAYNAIRRAGEFGAEAEHSASVRSALASVMLGLDDAETGQRGFLLTGDSAYLGPFSRGKSAVPPALASLTSLLRSDPADEKIADSLQRLATNKFTELDLTVRVRAQSGFSPALGVVEGGRGKSFMDAARELVARLSQREAGRLREASLQQQRQREFGRVVLFIGIALAVLLGFLANARVVREANRLAKTVSERDAANRLLHEQAAELEAANEELTISGHSLQEQAIELEQQTEEAQALAEELELTNGELTRANDQLEERSQLALRAEDIARSASKAKSDFLAMMSHEIRTPINAVVGYSELLALGLSGPLTDEQRNQVQRIQQSTRHLLQLVNEVLDLAKIESGTLRVDAGHGQVGATVAAALDLVRTQAHAKQITLADRCEGFGDVIYCGDEDRVRQILLNLLSNAIKFTRPGGAVTVSAHLGGGPPEMGLEADSPCIAITVADSGIGIASNDFVRIFEPFTQVESEGRNAYTREQTGTGLGLPISRQLATLMGGTLEVTSTVGVGSEFTLCLPANPAPSDAKPSSERMQSEV